MCRFLVVAKDLFFARRRVTTTADIFRGSSRRRTACNLPFYRELDLASGFIMWAKFSILLLWITVAAGGNKEPVEEPASLLSTLTEYGIKKMEDMADQEE